jgi:hypothetical protein
MRMRHRMRIYRCRSRANRVTTQRPFRGLAAGVSVCHSQCLKASFTLSAPCLTLPVAWSARPSALSRRFPVTRPAPFSAVPLVVCALCLIFFRILTGLSPFRSRIQRPGRLTGGRGTRGVMEKRFWSVPSQEHDGKHDDHDDHDCSEADKHGVAAPLFVLSRGRSAQRLPGRGPVNWVID